MKQKLTDLYAKNGTKKVLASLLSILAGLLLGSIVVIIVGLAEQKITTAGMWGGRPADFCRHPQHRARRCGRADLGL